MQRIGNFHKIPVFQDNWTPQKLVVKHPSRPFNPDVATTFFRAGLIEAWGRGTLKILSECKNARLPKAVFAIDGSDITVELRAKGSKTVEKTVEKTDDLILELIAQDPKITAAKLREKTGLTRRGIEYNLEKLKADGKIERIGPDKGVVWRVR